MHVRVSEMTGPSLLAPCRPMLLRQQTSQGCLPGFPKVAPLTRLLICFWGCSRSSWPHRAEPSMGRRAALWPARSRHTVRLYRWGTRSGAGEGWRWTLSRSLQKLCTLGPLVSPYGYGNQGSWEGSEFPGFIPLGLTYALSNPQPHIWTRMWTIWSLFQIPLGGLNYVNLYGKQFGKIWQNF